MGDHWPPDQGGDGHVRVDHYESQPYPACDEAQHEIWNAAWCDGIDEDEKCLAQEECPKKPKVFIWGKRYDRHIAAGNRRINGGPTQKL